MKKYLRYIDLRSDTFTKPTAGMLDAMRDAECGDDCYGEDSSVNELQNYASDYFGKEAALYFPTGTMTNAVAMRTLINPGEEVILDKSFHVNFFESAQMADFSGAVLNVCKSNGGIITVEKLKRVIDSKCRSSTLYTKPKMLVIENTINSHGGKVFPLEALKSLFEYTSANGMILYMDGARLFNACAASGVDPKEYAKYTDCLAVCLSKGLGAPMGSMLLGKKEVIERAKIYRKRFGGSFHQAGYMAAAGLYALKNNFERLKDDHENIQVVAAILRDMPGISVVNAETNMVLFDVKALGVDAKKFVELAKQRGLLLIAWQENVVRIVTHLNVSREDVLRAGATLAKLAEQLRLPNEAREDFHPQQSLASLLQLLESKNMPCAVSDKNPLAIQVTLDKGARKFYEFALEAGIEVNVVSKDCVELIIAGNYSNEELQDIADKLSGAYLRCVELFNSHQQAASATANVQRQTTPLVALSSSRHQFYAQPSALAANAVTVDTMNEKLGKRSFG